MKIPTEKNFLRLSASLLALSLTTLSFVSFTAAAQSWPDRPVRVIVPVPAGGNPDVITRIVTPSMSAQLGHQLVVDNRGGAGGLIGAELAARATPDGYTLFFTSPGSMAILPYLYKKVAYDPVRDFVPVGLIASGPFLLVVHPSVQAKTVKELVALAKAQPGKLNVASAGNGSANHLAAELFKSMAGVDIAHIPYKGAPLAVTDLLAGNVQIMFNSIPPMIQHIKSGRVRLLATGSAKRSPQVPDAPTISEAGVPGYEAVTWVGIVAPAKTPPAILKRVHEVMVKAVNAPEVRSQFAVLGMDPVGGTPAEFAALIKQENEKYAKVVKASGAKID